MRTVPTEVPPGDALADNWRRLETLVARVEPTRVMAPWRPLLELIHAGHAEQAWELPNAAWRGSAEGTRAFGRSLIRQLRTSPAWPALVEMNGAAIGPQLRVKLVRDQGQSLLSGPAANGGFGRSKGRSLDRRPRVVTLFVPMVKKLQQVGNSHAIVLDRAIREAIGLQPDDAVQITVSGDSLIITPARVGLGKGVVTKSLKKIRPRYRVMLRNLAK